MDREEKDVTHKTKRLTSPAVHVAIRQPGSELPYTYCVSKGLFKPQGSK